MDPNSFNQAPMAPAAQTPAPAPIVKQNSSNALKIAVAFSIAVAMCGLGFGIFGMSQASQKKVDLSDLEVQVKTESGEIATIDTSKISTSTNTDNNNNEKQVIVIPQSQVSKPENLDKYIYIAQWGIKIKMPDTLTVTGYYYSAGTVSSVGIYTQLSCDGGCQDMPDFANSRIISSPVGALSRVDYDYPSLDKTLIGTKVATVGNYDYYYSGPQDVVSTTADEQAKEVETVNKLKEALTDSSNYSEI